MNTKFPLRIVALFLISLSVGCGGNCIVTGEVKFADGTPLTEGQVVFESANLTAKGNIQPDGKFSMMAGEEKGVPQGSYQVCIQGFGDPKIQEIINPSGGPSTLISIMEPSPIHEKFFATGTSGLVCEVKKRMTYNITVEPPDK